MDGGNIEPWRHGSRSFLYLRIQMLFCPEFWISEHFYKFPTNPPLRFRNILHSLYKKHPRTHEKLGHVQLVTRPVYQQCCKAWISTAAGFDEKCALPTRRLNRSRRAWTWGGPGVIPKFWAVVRSMGPMGWIPGFRWDLFYEWFIFLGILFSNPNNRMEKLMVVYTALKICGWFLIPQNFQEFRGFGMKNTSKNPGGASWNPGGPRHVFYQGFWNWPEAFKIGVVCSSSLG